jgi:hypothetical protein
MTTEAIELIEASLTKLGVIRSMLKTRSEAPKQGHQGAPDAWLELEAWVNPSYHDAAERQIAPRRM